MLAAISRLVPGKRTTCGDALVAAYSTPWPVGSEAFVAFTREPLIPTKMPRSSSHVLNPNVPAPTPNGVGAPKVVPLSVDTQRSVRDPVPPQLEQVATMTTLSADGAKTTGRPASSAPPPASKLSDSERLQASASALTRQ